MSPDLYLQVANPAAPTQTYRLYDGFVYEAEPEDKITVVDKDGNPVELPLNVDGSDLLISLNEGAGSNARVEDFFKTEGAAGDLPGLEPEEEIESPDGFEPGQEDPIEVGLNDEGGSASATIVSSGGGATMPDDSFTLIHGSNVSYTGFNGNATGTTGTSTAGAGGGGSQPNRGPQAVTDNVEVDEDSSIEIKVLTNDTDPDGDRLVIDEVGEPQNGTVEIIKGGTVILYTPNPDFHGEDTFSYRISDGRGGFSTAQINVDVAMVVDGNINVKDGSNPVIDESGDQGAIEVLALETTETGGVEEPVAGNDGTLTFFGNGDYDFLPSPTAVPGNTETFAVTYLPVGGGDPVTELLVFEIQDDGSAELFPPTVTNGPGESLFDDPDNNYPQDGTLVINSVDVPGNSGPAGTPVEGANGVIVVNEDGTYDYVMDADNPLGDGEQEVYTLVYTDIHGNETTEMITIVGDGDGGAELFPHTSGYINIPDTSNPEVDDAAVQGDITVTALETGETGEAGDLVDGNDGTLVFNEDGTFDFTPSEDAVPGNYETFTVEYPPLGGGDPVTETLTFYIQPDGTAIIIPPTLTNDPGESLFDDPDNNFPQSGTLVINSVDVPGNSGPAGTPVEGANGIIVVNEDGTYDYVMDIDNPLGEGEQEVYTLVYTDIHGNETTEMITIVGDGDGGAELFPHTSGIINNPDISNPLVDDAAVPGDITVTALETGETGEAGDLVDGNDGTLVFNEDGTFDFTPSEDAVPGNYETFTVEYPPVGGGEPVTETLTFYIQPDGTAIVVMPTITNAPGWDFFDDPDNELPTAGTIVVASVDSGEYGPVGSPVDGDNGFLVFNGDGTFDYVMDPSNPLSEDETETYTITYTDENGKQTQEIITIVGNGSGGAYVQPPVSDSIDTADSSSNPLPDDDTIPGEIVVTSLNTNDTGGGSELVDGDLGTIVFNPDGTYDYNPDPDAPAGTDVFTVTYPVPDPANPGDTMDITETLTFVNDGNGNVVVKDPTSGTIGGSGDPDTTNPSVPPGTAAGEVIVSHPAPGGGVETTAGNPLDGNFGTVVVNSDGTFDYVAEDGHPAGSEDTFLVTYPNPAGGPPITETLTFVHDGSGDAPLFQPDSTGDLDAPGESPNIDPTASISVQSRETGQTGEPGDLINGDDSGLVFNPDGTFDINVHPDSDAAPGDTETFTVTYTSTGGDSTQQDIVVEYDGAGGANVLPFGADESNGIFEGTVSVSGDVVNYDTDGGTAVVTGGGAGTYGTLTIDDSGTGAYTYSLNNGAANVEQLAAGETVTDSFNYTVDDGNGGQTTHSIDITVTGINDAPVALGDALTINEDSPATSASSLLQNDTDVDNGSILSVSEITVGGDTFAVPPAGAITVALGSGNVTVHSDGTYSFDPASGYESLGSATETASESFSYTVTDEHGATHTANVNFTITGTNDAPVIEANSVPVTEGAVNPVDNTMILVTDVDDTPAEITITPDNVVAGYFALATDTGTPIASFTQENVNNGDIVFVHDGSETPASWDLTASDPAGLEDTDSFDSANDPENPFTYVNDAPEIDNNSAPITEGETTVITGPMVHAADPDNTDTELTFTVDTITGGQFELAAMPGSPILSFTQADIEAGRVQFVHDGSETVPQWTLTVSDGELTDQSSFDGNVSGPYTPVNDGPVITVNSVPVTEGETTAIDNTMIHSDDPDNTPAELVYTLTDVEGGEFQLIASGTPVTTFTQEQIDNGEIQFVHDGSETPAAWDLEVTDGELNDTDTFNSDTDTNNPFVPVNDAPVIDVNTATFSEGDTVTLNAANLHSTDPDNTDSQLTYTIDAVAGGHFQFAAVPGTPIASFTQADIESGRVQYVHNGDETAPAWSLTVDDGELTDSSSFNGATSGTYTSVNDGPVLDNNTITLSEGDTVSITTDNISASDPDNTPAELTYTLNNVVAGHFALTSAPATPITTFTQEDIESGDIIFVHDGGETPPSWDITVEDPAGLSDSDSFSAAPAPTGEGTFTPVNDGPDFDTNTAPITEGGTTVLDASMIHSADPDNTDPQLTYSVDAIAGGQFEFTAIPGTPIGTFTQDDINNGRIQFVHDGSETAPAWTLTVTDGELTDSSSFNGATDTDNPFVRVNDGPAIENNSMTITEGATHPVTAGDISASDVDNTPAELTFTVSAVVAGHFEVNGTPATTFTQKDINDGLVEFIHDGSENPASWDIEVSDGELTDDSSFASSTGDGSFIPVNDAPVIVNNSATITEGGTTVITNTEISATDPDNTAAELTFTVSSVTGGQFELAGDPGVEVTSFTQTDVDSGIVRFVHDGSETVPGWDLSVSDGELADTDNFTASIGGGTFIPVNDTPVAFAASASINEKSDDLTAGIVADAVTGTDPDGDSLIYTTGDTATYGSLTLNTDGTYSYSLDNSLSSVQALNIGDSLTDTFTIDVSDGNGGTTSTTLTITINGTNDSPSLSESFATVDNNTDPNAVDDGVISVTETGTVTIDVMANDTDADGHTFFVGEIEGNPVTSGVPFVLASGASVTVLGDGNLYYDPAGAFSGLGDGDTAPDSFTYTIVDAQGGTSTATVTMEVSGESNYPDTSGNVYLTQDGILKTLVVDALNEEFDLITVGPATGTIPNVNSTGFRIADGMLYAVDTETDELLRIDPASGNYEVVGNLGVDVTHSGDFNAANGLYYIRTADSDLVAVDVDTATVDHTVNVSGTMGADIAYNPVDGLFYHVAGGNLRTIDPTTGDNLLVGPTGNISSAGGMYADANGNVFAVQNNPGGIYQMDTSTGAGTFVANAPNSGGNDGAAASNVVTPLVAPHIFLDTDGSSNSATGDFTTSFSQGGAPVAIADSDAKIVDMVGTGVASASVVLTNAADDDQLIIGALPPGVVASLDVSVPGTIVLNLTGPATNLEYADILKDITFFNASQTPDSTPRNLEVIVIDLDGNLSKSASTTIHIEGTGALDGVVLENSGDVVTGDASEALSDPDAGDTHVFSTEDTAAHGTFTINTDGTWSYDVDDADPAVQQLGAGETLVETFSVTVTDANGLTDTEDLDITIYGTNDAPHVVTAMADITFEVETVPPLPDPPTDPDQEVVEAILSGGEAYFRGSFVEAGIRDNGTFGASNPGRPAGFHDSRSETDLFGFISNSADNNWATYDGDFFTPGNPAEGFGIEFNGTAFTNNTSGDIEQISGSITGAEVVTLSGQDFAQVYWSGTITSGGATIQVDRTFSIAENGLYVRMDTTLTNTSGTDATGVYWMHTLDPDNNQSINGSYTTTNTLVSKPDGTDNLAVVGATQPDGSSIMFVAEDARARGYHGVFNEDDASDAWNNGNGQAVGTTVVDDTGMQMAFNLGTITAGSSETFTYAYNLSSDITSVLGNLTAPDNSVEIDLTDHFDDVDLVDTPENLTYTISMSDGSDVPAWLTVDGTTLSGSAPIDSSFTATVVVTATDSQGASASDTITIEAVETVPPIVIDMDGDGAEFIGRSAGFEFDVDADGTTETTAWAGTDDGVLVFDHQQDGDVTERSEIAFADYLEGAQTDLEGLAAFDTDGSGSLDAGDEEFSKFGVWQDENGNGVVDLGELLSLDEVGIESISLNSDGDSYSAADGDVHVHGEATVHYTDGSTGTAADAEFSFHETASSLDEALAVDLGQSVPAGTTISITARHPAGEGLIEVSESDATGENLGDSQLYQFNDPGSFHLIEFTTSSETRYIEIGFDGSHGDIEVQSVTFPGTVTADFDGHAADGDFDYVENDDESDFSDLIDNDTDDTDFAVVTESGETIDITTPDSAGFDGAGMESAPLAPPVLSVDDSELL